MNKKINSLKYHPWQLVQNYIADKVKYNSGIASKLTWFPVTQHIVDLAYATLETTNQ